LFTAEDFSRTGFMSKANISDSWWLRSASSDLDYFCFYVYTSGIAALSGSQGECVVVPTFVIG
jgi:hypothetical protein